MTLECDIERARMLAGKLSVAASEIQSHNPPDWISHHCDDIKRYAASFAQALTACEKELEAAK